MALRQIQERYSKFILDACKNSSKIGLPTNRTSISRNLTFQKRFYLKNREYEDQGYWFQFQNPIRVGLSLLLFSYGVFVAVSSGKWVTVPYTERSHFLVFHKIPEEDYTTYEGERLPPFHPDSITARTIFQDIINQAFPIELDIKRSLEENENDNKPNCEIIILDWLGDHLHVTSQLLHHYKNHEEMLATIFGKEIEADHIGLMLAASAGYNPEVGVLHPVYGYEHNQRVLQLHNLSESIPKTIGNLQNLVDLSLACNRLKGSIPVSVGSMYALETLDLTYNNLSGSIPKSMEALQYLHYFNVSFNDLNGEIPHGGPFRNFTLESF